MASWADLIGPAVQTAGGWYASQQAKDDENKRAAEARGDAGYTGASGLQSQFMSQAAGNPDQMAAQRFNAQQGIVAPAYAKSESDLMRSLFQKGMLGLGTSAGAGVDPITGQPQTWTVAPGQQTNPLMAAYQAAKLGQQGKDAYAAMREGQEFQRNQMSNAATAADMRAKALATARAAQPQISKASGMGDLFKGLGGMLTNPAVTKALGGLFSGDMFGGADAKYGMPSADQWSLVEGGVAPVSGGFSSMFEPVQISGDLFGGWDGGFGDSFGGWDGGWSTGDSWSF